MHIWNDSMWRIHRSSASGAVVVANIMVVIGIRVISVTHCCENLVHVDEVGRICSCH